ncbi:hypothetical protein N0V90_002941 [Kalmusia sp. IMI 367209]|nr:hypothetical protein N0V90_002941 [Kalmusia sp. IMI 367209]
MAGVNMDIEPADPAPTTGSPAATISSKEASRDASKAKRTAKKRSKKALRKQEANHFVQQLLHEKRMGDLLTDMGGLGMESEDAGGNVDSTKTAHWLPSPARDEWRESAEQSRIADARRLSRKQKATQRAEQELIVRARCQFKVQKRTEARQKIARGRRLVKVPKLEPLPSPPRLRSGGLPPDGFRELRYGDEDQGRLQAGSERSRATTEFVDDTMEEGLQQPERAAVPLSCNKRQASFEAPMHRENASLVGDIPHRAFYYFETSITAESRAQCAAKYEEGDMDFDIEL